MNERTSSELKFLDRHSLSAWLRENPGNWGQEIAVRAVLRALPKVEDLKVSLSNRVTFSFIRAALVASLPDSEHARAADRKIASEAAIAEAEACAERIGKRARMASNAAYAVSAAAYAVRAAFYPAAQIDNVSYAAHAAAFAAAAYANGPDGDLLNVDSDAARPAAAKCWAEISADARWLSARGSIASLTSRPLWTMPNMLTAAKSDWVTFKRRFVTNAPGCDPWIAWYEGLLPFASATPCNVFSEELWHKIAYQADEWWKREAVAVNTDVTLWLAAPRDRAAKAKAIADRNNRFFAARAKAVTDSVEIHLRQGRSSINGGVRWIDAVDELERRLAGGRK